MIEVHLFKTPDCPSCRRIESILSQIPHDSDILFRDHDLSTAEGLAELRSMDIFELTAPVLVVKGRHGQLYVTSKGLERASKEGIADMITRGWL